MKAIIPKNQIKKAYPSFLDMPDFWWALTGSNRRHSACKADALPAELIAHNSHVDYYALYEDIFQEGYAKILDLYCFSGFRQMGPFNDRRNMTILSCLCGKGFSADGFPANQFI